MGQKTLSILLIFMLSSAGICHAAANCRFTSASATLNYGTLDPGMANDVAASTSLIFRCGGADPVVFSITDDDGLYETGADANRMINTAVPTEYLPYSFTITPVSGTVPKNTNTNITISGVVKGVDYQNAYVGPYTDSVTITIVP